MKKYYLQEWNSPLPHCKRCFNFGASCGTPCTNCEGNEKWSKNWVLYLYLEDRFMIYQRRPVEEIQSVQVTAGGQKYPKVAIPKRKKK